MLGSGLYDELAAAALIVAHREAPEIPPISDDALLVVKPRQLDFISYPYEWTFSELKDAALTTIDIQERALNRGMTLKDASAYNIQFVDGRPMLIDTLSFERLVPDEPWVAYRQFCQHFLAPLAVMACRDVRLGLMLGPMLDGMPLDLAARLLPGRTRLRPGMGAHVHLHARAERRSGSGAVAGTAKPKGRVSDTGRRALLDSLRRTIEGLRWSPDDTPWAGYTTTTSYSASAAASKKRLVAEMIARTGPGRVWDIGANDATYSAIAASTARKVIALDSDAGAMERVYLKVRAGNIDGVQPFVVNIANPSPSMGVALAERRSIVDRGPAPTVMALALIHHLAIGANVPLPLLASFFSSIGEELIIEFVPKDDPQTMSLLQSRRDVFPGYSLEGFRAAFSRHYDLLEEVAIEDSGRVLFRMRRPPA